MHRIIQAHLLSCKTIGEIFGFSLEAIRFNSIGFKHTFLLLGVPVELCADTASMDLKINSI